jgi:hypothetical protein
LEKIRVILWGLGSMGTLAAKIIAEKEGIEVVGAVDTDPRKIGRALSEITGCAGQEKIIVTGNEDEALAGGADAALLAVSSFVRDTTEPLKKIIRSGKNAITIAEEWAYPWQAAPVEAGEIDRAARASGVTALGTGVNPGFVLDTLIIALTGACADVRKITARRVNDLSPFGHTVMETQGVGRSPEEFSRGLADGSIVGHIGFRQSVGMIAASLGVRLDEVTESIEPIISRTRRKSPRAAVEPGQVAGCSHRAEGRAGGRPFIVLEHPQQICPEAEGIETGDFITIEGTPDINVAITPEIPGGTATAALAVNMIPCVLNAPPGLVTMAELPVPAARLSDFMQFLK